jgi:Ca2+-binding RTX toxin-like protein
MIRRILFPLASFAIILMIVVSVVSAVAAGNTVPPTRLSDTSRAIGVNDLKPPECAAINLVNIVVCPAAGGTCTGTSKSDLILGSANADTITGKGGNDCILGGGGDDSLNGNGGTGDVCIGGPGNDTFTNCETQIQ